jgi:hypothetical protein
MNDEVCKALFVLHQIKVGPSTLMVRQKNTLIQRVFELETRALKFLAGYGEWENPQELLEALDGMVREVSATVPKKHLGRGNPGKTKALTGDIWVARQHKATGRKIPELIREAQESTPPKLDPYGDVDAIAKRIRDLVRSGTEI